MRNQVNTIGQYKCLKHMESWGLSEKFVKIDLIDDNTIKVTDYLGKSMIISIDSDGTIREDGIPARIAHA